MEVKKTLIFCYCFLLVQQLFISFVLLSCSLLFFTPLVHFFGLYNVFTFSFTIIVCHHILGNLDKNNFSLISYFRQSFFNMIFLLVYNIFIVLTG